MSNFQVIKSIQEINEKIKSGQAVVVTAEGRGEGGSAGGRGHHRDLCSYVFLRCFH
jgi:hypothetical protein